LGRRLTRAALETERSRWKNRLRDVVVYLPRIGRRPRSVAILVRIPPGRGLLRRPLCVRATRGESFLEAV